MVALSMTAVRDNAAMRHFFFLKNILLVKRASMYSICLRTAGSPGSPNSVRNADSISDTSLMGSCFLLSSIFPPSRMVNVKSPASIATIVCARKPIRSKRSRKRVIVLNSETGRNIDPTGIVDNVDVPACRDDCGAGRPVPVF